MPPEIYRHNDTAEIYEVICNARIEKTGELVIVYKHTISGERWIRPALEFNDGRFVRITCCVVCDEQTGRREENSIYLPSKDPNGKDLGPLCESCCDERLGPHC